MRMKAIAILTICFLFSACGPSKEELQQQQQAHDDSVKVATEQRMQAKHDLEIAIMELENQIDKLKSELISGNSELEVAEDRLDRIKEWQFGRTPDEREEQIRNQMTLIQNLEDALNSHKTSITESEERLASLKVELQSYQ